MGSYPVGLEECDLQGMFEETWQIGLNYEEIQTALARWE